jgi:error-prone DNA polymerase
MVHPYLRRRNGEEKVTYPSEALKKVLEKTKGVPLFQEQAMSIAMVGAGFTDAQADGLRRAMATFKRNGDIGKYETMFIEGMVRNGYDHDFANRCFSQIKGFSDYGFPESHAASFAKLAYISAWMKCHYPDVFACALLNSQPMGFYAPAQIVRDARDHGVEVRPVDVNYSDWHCTIEEDGKKTALRLGMSQVKGLKEDDALALVEARGRGYTSLRDAWRRSRLDPRPLERLADADAWRSVDLDRRAALWEVRALKERPLPLFDHVELTARPGDNAPPPELAAEPVVELPEMTMGEHVIEDYSSLSLSLKAHPLSLLRESDDLRGCVLASSLVEAKHNARINVAGLVLVRQRPGTASGVVFVTLEDETGVANLVVWPSMLETYRREVMRSKLLIARGRVQREGIVVHVVIDRLADRTDLLQALSPRFFHGIDQTIAHADEIRRPGYDRRTRVMPASRDFH